MSQNSIFISFSKDYAGKVAKKLKVLLEDVFGDKVSVFASNTNIVSGDWQNTIHENISNAKYAISILSPENIKDSPWLMYEAGALIMSVGNKKDSLMPFLFCRHIDDLEAPIARLQVQQYQLNSDSNKQSIINILNAINIALGNHIAKAMLETTLEKYWKDFDDSLGNIAQEMLAKANWRNGIETKNNEFVFSESLVTCEQSDIGFIFSDFYPKTPRELETYFEKILEKHIPDSWKFLEQQPQTKEATRVLIGNTRISTFVSFTDGENILVFDRPNASRGKTNVINNKIDVFGAVQFENRSLSLKIENNEFLDAPIKQIKPIYGIAVEENRPVDRSGIEAVIMVGINIFMDEKDLQKACKTNSGFIKIYKISTLASIQTKLTSKAHLSVMSLL